MKYCLWHVGNNVLVSERTGRYAMIFKLLNQFERLADKQQLKWLQNLDRVNIQTRIQSAAPQTHLSA